MLCNCSCLGSSHNRVYMYVCSGNSHVNDVLLLLAE